MSRAKKLSPLESELLSALILVTELLAGFEEADQPEDGEEPIVAPVLKKARAAIAKATGASHE